MVTLIGDPGSCHDGDLGKARELIKIGADAGLSAVKLQLLQPAQCQNGNIMLNWEHLPDLIDLGKSLGVEVFARAFDLSGAEWLASCCCKSIKFAYSQTDLLSDARVRNLLPNFSRVYVSLDVMKPKPTNLELISLYCVPEYPIRYVLDFEGIFQRFSGFSSHCLGVQQEIRAVEAGAKFLEFHYKGAWDSRCPDARFAKSPKLAGELCRRIRG